MLEYPWKRDTLIAWLKEMIDVDFQTRVWGTSHDGIYEGVQNAFDYFIEDENLDDDAASWVSYYLFDSEVESIQTFAKTLRGVVMSMQDQFDSVEAINHKDWHRVISTAQTALEKVLHNNSLHGIP